MKKILWQAVACEAGLFPQTSEDPGTVLHAMENLMLFYSHSLKARADFCILPGLASLVPSLSEYSAISTLKSFVQLPDLQLYHHCLTVSLQLAS